MVNYLNMIPCDLTFILLLWLFINFITRWRWMECPQRTLWQQLVKWRCWTNFFVNCMIVAIVSSCSLSIHAPWICTYYFLNFNYPQTYCNLYNYICIECVVLFSISDYLDMRGYKHSRLDGSTNRVMREVKINLFNKPNSPQFIFCLSTR